MSQRKETLKAALAAGRTALLSAVGQLSAEDWDRPTDNPAWTARDLLIHLAVAEPGLLTRMSLFLEGRSQLPEGFDLNVWNNRQVARRRGASVESLLASLAESRQKVLAFLDEIADEQLDVRGFHASGRELSVAEMVEIIGQHEQTHARDILTARRH